VLRALLAHKSRDLLGITFENQWFKANPPINPGVDCAKGTISTQKPGFIGVSKGTKGRVKANSPINPVLGVPLGGICTQSTGFIGVSKGPGGGQRATFQ
jgi:hypothetical protein